MEGQGLGLLRQRGPFLSPSSLAVFLWGISSRGYYCMFIALVSLPDLSQIKSPVRSGTELTSVYTPTPCPGAGGGDTGSAWWELGFSPFFSEVLRALSSFSLSVSLPTPTELRGPPPACPFSRALPSLPKAL